MTSVNEDHENESIEFDAAHAVQAEAEAEANHEYYYRYDDQDQQLQQQQNHGHLEHEDEQTTYATEQAVAVEAAKISEAVTLKLISEAVPDPTRNVTNIFPAPSTPAVALYPTWPSPDEMAESAVSVGEKRKAPPPESASEQQAHMTHTYNNSNNNSNSKRATPTRVSWEDRMIQLKDYIAEHGNLAIPIRYKQNPSLGKFVHNTREQYKLYHNRTKAGYKKKCSLTEARIQELEDMGFLWTTERSKRQSDDWNKRLEQLKEYKITHGDCLVPHGYEEDSAFAEWIHRQRTTYAAMIKSPDQTSELIKIRMTQLEGLGFNFTVHDDKWMEHYEQLKEYKVKHGDCLVPTHYADNPRLGRWTHTQRHQRRQQVKGKRSCITEERIALLDEIGFQWEVRPAFQNPRATWQQRYDELRIFHSKNGHFCMSSSHDDPLLHAWAIEQRTRLRNIAIKGQDSSRRMGPDRIELLSRIGFTREVELGEAMLPKSR